MKKILLFIFLGFVLFSQQNFPYTGFTLDSTNTPHNLFWQESDNPDSFVKNLIANMSDEEILGQIFLTSWSSDTPNQRIIEWAKRGLGGIKIFGWNVSTLDKLTKTVTQLQNEALKSHLGIPLLVSTDQEGGWVRHIKDKTSLTPGNLAIGATNLPYDAYQTALYIGEEIRNLGVNLNLAPTVDVYESLLSDVIGPRSFSSDPKSVMVLSISYFKGLEANRIISTAKHFPGHGNTPKDSHGVVPVVKTDYAKLMDTDFLPYRGLIKNNLPAIMVGHLNYPLLSNDDAPATLSSSVLKGILRDKLHFKGVLITDDMYMTSVQNYAKRNGLDEVGLIIRAQKSGMNLLLFSKLIPQSVFDKLLDAYKVDIDFQNAVKKSCYRILKMKTRYLKDKNRVPLTPSKYDVYQKIPSRLGSEFFQNHALRAVTLIKNEKVPLLRLPNENNNNILIISQDPDFVSISQNFYPGSKIYKYSFEPRLKSIEKEKIEKVLELGKDSKTIIFNLVNPRSLSLLKGLKSLKDKIIVISALTPALLKDAQWVKTAIAVYGWSKNEYRAGFFVLTGKVIAKGKLPIRIQD